MSQHYIRRTGDGDYYYGRGFLSALKNEGKGIKLYYLAKKELIIRFGLSAKEADEFLKHPNFGFNHYNRFDHYYKNNDFGLKNYYKYNRIVKKAIARFKESVWFRSLIK